MKTLLALGVILGAYTLLNKEQFKRQSFIRFGFFPIPYGVVMIFAFLMLVSCLILLFIL